MKGLCKHGRAPGKDCRDILRDCNCEIGKDSNVNHASRRFQRHWFGTPLSAERMLADDVLYALRDGGNRLGVNTARSPTFSCLTGPRKWLAWSLIHNSGTISPTSFPWQNRRTTELSDTTI